MYVAGAKRKSDQKQTLPYEKLVEMYNKRFEIQEEMDVMKRIPQLSESRRFDQLSVKLTYVNNVITIGETNYTKSRLTTVGKLLSVIRTMQIADGNSD